MFWAGEHDAERQAKKLEVELAAARRTCAEQRAQLDEQHAELERLRAIAEPQASAFKAGNHFNAAVDLAIVQVRAMSQVHVMSMQGADVCAHAVLARSASASA